MMEEKVNFDFFSSILCWMINDGGEGEAQYKDGGEGDSYDI